MNQFIQKNRWNLLIWGITLFFSLLYLSLIFSKNIWTDEAYTLQLIEGSFLDIIKGTANDVHPPLYYFFAKVIDFIFPNELLPQKLLTILPMSLTLVLGATKIRKLFGEIPSFFFLLFLTCIPCTMEFSVQVRMYSLALLFVTLCGVSAYELYVEPKRIHWILFTFSALGAGYTHYFSLVSVAVIVGLLFLVFVAKRKPLKPMLCSMACMILLYLPWFLILIQQLNRVTTSYWIPEITSHTIWSYFTWIFDLKLLPGTVYVFCLLFVYLIG
ncbi:MAG: glycosyltransferase family 39 protein, partial [Lachnospiraceae bacterium]